EPRAEEVQPHAGDGTGSHAQHRPGAHAGTVRQQQGVDAVVEQAAGDHGGHVARPFAGPGGAAPVGEGPVAVDQPGGGGGAQDRGYARQVRPRAQGHQRMEEAAADQEADEAADAEADQPDHGASSFARSPGAGRSTTPRSVTMASTRSAGVTSNTGFQARTPGAAVGVPPRRVSSAPSRSSISMPCPSGMARSTVLDGATTITFTPW